MAVIYPFGEGVVEKVVFEFLASTVFKENKFQRFNISGGKRRLRAKIIDTVKSNIDAKRDEIRIIVFRDLDDGETMDSISQSFSRIVDELLESWGVRPKKIEVDPSIHKWEISHSLESPGFKFVLHIARADNMAVSIRNQTTDAYVLRLGLSENVLRRFADDRKVKSNYETLNELITISIPNLITNNGITFDEDKDYLAAYLVVTRFWAVKRTEEQARLIRIILERGWKHNRGEFEQIFKSWIQAIKEVVR